MTLILTKLWFKQFWKILRTSRDRCIWIRDSSLGPRNTSNYCLPATRCHVHCSKPQTSRAALLFPAREVSKPSKPPHESQTMEIVEGCIFQKIHKISLYTVANLEFGFRGRVHFPPLLPSPSLFLLPHFPLRPFDLWLKIVCVWGELWVAPWDAWR